MDIMIEPSRLCGTLDAVSSKSYVQRLLICAGLADSVTRIYMNNLSDDIKAVCRCLCAMGCSITNEADGLSVFPLHAAHKSSAALDSGESGAAARFLMPLAAHLFDNFTMSGQGRLPGRPIAPLCRALAQAGASFDSDTLPLSGRGKIRAGNFLIEGDVSSQFISGLLFALPLLEAESRITLTTPPESAAYVDMTIDVLKLFGIEIQRSGSGFLVPGKQRYTSPGTAQAEGDWSNAAFFLCMGALGGQVTVKGLSPDSTQGDAEIINILKRFGTHAENCTPGGGAAASRGTLAGTDIDVSQIPDLAPVLAVAASAAKGETRIINARRLRLKESDRIQSIFNMLSALGSDIAISGDSLVIRGKERLSGGTVDGAGDHRIVMAAAAAACLCDKPVIIKGCQAVNKSYPSFFEDFRAIGGKTSVV